MRLPRPGLRGKLALSIVLVLLGALAFTYFAVYRGTGSELEKRTETDLERELETLSGKLSSGGVETPGQYATRARRLVGQESFGQNARVISISVENGGVATNQPALVSPGIDDHPSGEEGGHEEDERRENSDRILGSSEGYSTIEIDDVGEVRLLTSKVELPGGVGATIRIGQPLAPVDTALKGLSDTFLLVGIAVILLVALASWLLASSVTRPMRKLASVAEEVDSGDLSRRMPVEGTRDEARRLAESFNGMLDRLEDAFERQRAFVADASHDLRTPLTVVRGQIEVLARNPDPSPDDVERVSGLVTRAIARMERMVDDLLLLARSESPEDLRPEILQLEPLLTGEAESMVLPGNRELVVGPVTDLPVRIDRELIARALGNLIANAATHTGEEGRIEVSARELGDFAALTVDDDGPGIPSSERERVFDRFARLDRARTSSDGGSGLGLAIVKAISEAHGGGVRCSESPLGGARFEILLPFPDDPAQ